MSKFSLFLAKRKGIKTFKTVAGDAVPLESLAKATETIIPVVKDDEKIDTPNIQDVNEFAEWVDPGDEEGTITQNSSFGGHLKLPVAHVEQKAEIKSKEHKPWSGQKLSSLSVTGSQPIESLNDDSAIQVEIVKPIAEDVPAARKDTSEFNTALPVAPNRYVMPCHRAGGTVNDSKTSRFTPAAPSLPDRKQFPSLSDVQEETPSAAKGAPPIVKRNIKRPPDTAEGLKKKVDCEADRSSIETNQKVEVESQNKSDSLRDLIYASLSLVTIRSDVTQDLDGSISKFKNKVKLPQKDLAASEINVKVAVA